MPANTSPIYVKVPRTDWTVIPASVANTAKDGTGTVYTAFTAHATEGSFVSNVKIRSLGTNVTTVIRLFQNNGSTNATAANNTLIAEITSPPTTVSEVAAQPEFDIPISVGLPAGHRLNIVTATSVAAGFAVTAFGGDY